MTLTSEHFAEVRVYDGMVSVEVESFRTIRCCGVHLAFLY